MSKPLPNLQNCVRTLCKTIVYHDPKTAHDLDALCCSSYSETQHRSLLVSCVVGLFPCSSGGLGDPGNKTTCIGREGLVTGAVVTNGCGEVNMLNNLSG